MSKWKIRYYKQHPPHVGVRVTGDPRYAAFVSTTVKLVGKTTVELVDDQPDFYIKDDPNEAKKETL
jgi:hypothetical protein